METTPKNESATVRQRLAIAFGIGLLAAIGCMVFGATRFAILSGWDVTILVYGLGVLVTVWGMGATETKSHAVREDPGRTLADVLLVAASVASLGAVMALILNASHSSGITKATEITLGLVSVVLSWVMVHLTYMLKYARLYYGQPEGGVDFNERSSPQYTDFAYMAFTLGMTFQVSDTSLQTKAIRATALRHALLSYLFGTIIIATTINALVSLSG